MIVVDASAIIDLLTRGPKSLAISARVRRARTLSAPHLLDAEVGQVLRRFERSGLITEAQASLAMTDLNALPITRFAHGVLLARAFELRRNTTIYDALYLVLAEALRAPLLTRDAALAKTPGHHAKVEVI